MNIGRKYKVDYTRYADDLTFSTNNKDFLNKHEEFCEEIKKEAELFGLVLMIRKLDCCIKILGKKLLD